MKELEEAHRINEVDDEVDLGPRGCKGSQGGGGGGVWHCTICSSMVASVYDLLMEVEGMVHDGPKFFFPRWTPPLQKEKVDCIIQSCTCYSSFAPQPKKALSAVRFVVQRA